jgi:hypothetical protein
MRAFPSLGLPSPFLVILPFFWYDPLPSYCRCPSVSYDNSVRLQPSPVLVLFCFVQLSLAYPFSCAVWSFVLVGYACKIHHLAFDWIATDQGRLLSFAKDGKGTGGGVLP